MFALSRVQRGLEALYRVETELDINDFLIDAGDRAALGLDRHAREQLLLSPDGDVGLFVCDTVLANLGENDPAEGVDDSNYADFLLAIEGVSHFVCLAWKASIEHRVTGLELELQAEIDKYLTLILGAGADDYRAHRHRIFYSFELEPDLSAEERERYTAANAAAAAYAAWLEARFVRESRHLELLREVRHFYRRSVADKLSYVAALGSA